MKNYCSIEWERGGHFTIKTWIEKETLGYWKAVSTCTASVFFISIPTSEEDIKDPLRACKYKTIYQTVEEYGVYIRYYEACYDECTGKQTSKTFLFQTDSGERGENLVGEPWEEEKFIDGFWNTF